ncbi:MAG: porin family protein [Holosporaceae bacterium]|jgi:opacity protein-like surface antigen|nr:porin family protein [Holosporaceae bacterium]
MTRYSSALAILLLFSAYVHAEDSASTTISADSAANETADKSAEENKDKAADEFLDLGEPSRNIGGAYWGLGLTWSSISHKLKATSDKNEEVNYKKSGNQFDVSLLGGFGAAFYKLYYTGIEAEFFKRFGGGTSYSNDDRAGLIHNSTMGLNMDVRLGRLFPEHGWLAYGTLGFARVLGRAVFRDADHNNKREGSFGSFYPTVGIGAEYKLTNRWNIRGDFRYSITSKDDGRTVSGWKYEAKPNRMAFRISITRSIL